MRFQYPQHRSNSHLFVRVVLTALVILVLNPFAMGLAAPNFQESTPEERALALLDGMTTEERIGQLFVVSFEGTETGPESQIHDLIVNHHIGGVILKAENDNFQPRPQTLTGLIQLTRSLQDNEWSATQEVQTDPYSGQEFTPAFVPLFIGLAQEGDGAPYDQILPGENSLTPVPSQMAIGATWQPELARQVGMVLGQELSALGINLFLGPSLDVLDAPQTLGTGDLGVRTFGGDPYWVGEMGRAYVSGLHQGSEGSIAVIGKHFPGHGSSDRLPEEEVATVRKSLEQLKLNELPPFEAITGNAPSTEATVDGLLASHIRYQGFQGNIRETTRPVSFDIQAFSTLMSLPAFAAWRDNGGVMITDDLGSRAFRSFTDPTGSDFRAPTIAREAFLTGNDLLYLGTGFVATIDQNSYETTLRTLDSFARKYNEDSAFKSRVDATVLRILTLKYKLHNNLFTRNEALASEGNLSAVGISQQVTSQVAQQAATLISPTPVDLADILPEGPTLNDRIVFITDVRTAQQCSECPEQPLLATDTFEQAVVRLYGPLAAGQVLQRNLASFSFNDLLAFLDGSEEVDTTSIETSLQQADWIVFAKLNVSTNNPSSQALSRFLAERPGLFRQKKLIVFAFNAPYFLDATEVSKLTAYYGLYSKTPQFVDVAARLLFQEVPAPGAPPVDVPGVSYQVVSATAPDPEQLIALHWDSPSVNPAEGTVTPEPTQVLDFEVGDLIAVRTGVIQDHNGHPVPDGTPVQFILEGAEAESPQVQNATTSRGIARATLLINRSGMVEVRVESDPARQSEVLRLEIPPVEGELPSLTETIVVTATPTLAPTPTATQALVETPAPPDHDQTTLVDWFIAIIVTGAVGSAIFWFATTAGLARWAVRSGFLALIGGLLAYSYLSMDMPGSADLLQDAGSWGVFMITLLGAVLGGAAAWGWQRLERGR